MKSFLCGGLGAGSWGWAGSQKGMNCNRVRSVGMGEELERHKMQSCGVGGDGRRVGGARGWDEEVESRRGLWE